MSTTARNNSPQGPYKLVTVNNVPERAKRLIGRVIEDLKDDYIIIHAANCENKDEIEPTVKHIQPDVLCCASMWSKMESDEMRAIATKLAPGIKTYAIPQGLQAERGPDAIVEHLKKQIPIILGDS